MVKKFSAQVSEIVLKNEKRINALVRQSTQEIIDQAQLPVAKGGRMRVDTGFLRASGQMSLTGLPSGPVRGDSSEPNAYDFDSIGVVTGLAKWKLGGTIYFGWTANYAKYREVYDGFLSTAVQNWPKIVAGVVAKIRARVGE